MGHAWRSLEVEGSSFRVNLKASHLPEGYGECDPRNYLKNIATIAIRLSTVIGRGLETHPNHFARSVRETSSGWPVRVDTQSLYMQVATK